MLHKNQKFTKITIKVDNFKTAQHIMMVWLLIISIVKTQKLVDLKVQRRLLKKKMESFPFGRKLINKSLNFFSVLNVFR